MLSKVAIKLMCVFAFSEPVKEHFHISSSKSNASIKFMWLVIIIITSTPTANNIIYYLAKSISLQYVPYSPTPRPQKTLYQTI